MLAILRLIAFMAYIFLRIYAKLHPENLDFDCLKLVCPHYCFPPVGTVSTSLLARVIRLLAKRSPVLDLGTGIGTLALTLARLDVYVVAVDLDLKCLRYAKINAKLNRLYQYLDTLACNGTSALRFNAFHLVVVNPPYLPLTPRLPHDLQVCGGARAEVTMDMLVWGLTVVRRGGLLIYALSSLSRLKPFGKAWPVARRVTPLDVVTVYVMKVARLSG